jgi:hypothetical protein
VDIQKKYDNLQKAEKEFVWAHPFAALDFNSNATTALAEAQKRFAAPSLHNGAGDAFRHCFWSAMNARDQGKDLAEAFGKAHEDWVGNPAAEKIMDLYNNSVGYEIGKYPGMSDRSLAVLCTQAWANNKLVQLDSYNGSDLVYSNSTENYLYQSR